MKRAILMQWIASVMSGVFLCGCVQSMNRVSTIGPYRDHSRSINRTLVVDNVTLKRDRIEAEMSIVSSVPQKKKIKTSTPRRATFAQRRGLPMAVLGTILTTAIYPITLLCAPGDKNLSRDLKKAVLLSPLGGLFWVSIREKSKTNVEEIVASPKINRRQLSEKSDVSLVSVDTNHSVVGEYVAGNRFQFDLIPELLLLDKANLKFHFDDFTTSTRLNVDSNINKVFNLSSDEKKIFRSLSKNSRIHYLMLSKSNRKRFIELDEGAQQKFVSVVSVDSIVDNWSVFNGMVTAKLWRWATPFIEEQAVVPIPPSSPKSPALISEPILPDVEIIKKSPFEDRAMFELRLTRMRQRREDQIAGIRANYRKNVVNRNDVVQKLEKTYNLDWKRYQEELELFRRDEARRLAEYKEEKSQRYKVLEEKKTEFLSNYFSAMFEPKLEAVRFDNGTPKYDAENARMYATLLFGKSAARDLERQVVFDVPPGEAAEELFKNLDGGTIKPSVQISFVDNALKIESISIPRGLFGEYTGIEAHNNIEKIDTIVPVTVALGSGTKTVRDALDQEMVTISTPKVSHIAPATQLVRQSEGLKDSKWDVVIQKAFADYKDDLPALLAKKSSKKVDPRKWLFIIGIENYQQTDRILHSKRSAEMFTKVAMKTLGVPSNQVILLSDDGTTSLPGIQVYPATAGSLKDQLRYLNRDLSKNDILYFYYSGHGLPLSENNNEPYFLAQDQAPDFIGEDPFFRVGNIYRLLSQSRANRIIAFMDSCFTGKSDGRSVFQGTKAATLLIPRKVDVDSKKMVVITAGSRKQFSNMYKEKGHRLFSYQLMKALLEDHTNVKDLFQDVFSNTRVVSRKMGGANLQEPTIIGNKQMPLM